MWNGKLKAVTFSYDDGVEDDRKLIDIWNRYGMKGTLNINSGRQDASIVYTRPENGYRVARIAAEELPELYAGHEVATHSYTHPHLENLQGAELDEEIRKDKETIENWFGVPIVGHAYPFGTWNEEVVEALEKNGLQYARTVVTTDSFAIPQRLLTWDCTCHHNHPRLMELAKEFVEADPNEPMLFSIWGHSYEFGMQDNWNVMEELCAYLSGRDDIFFGTNSEVLLG